MGGVCASNEKPAAIEEVEKDPAVKLTIMIIGARGLRRADWLPGMGMSKSFCQLKIAGKGDGSCLFQTKTINNTLTPLWRQETDITNFDDKASLEFSVWDEDDSLGKAVLKNDDFATKGFNGEIQLADTGKDIKAFLRVKVKVAGMDDYPPGPASEYTIKFDKDPKAKALGLRVDETDGMYIYVIDVEAGPFQTYNYRADVDKQLRSGDFLVKVNDKEGSSKEMLEELKTKTQFEIVARHPEEFCVAINKKEAKAPLGLEFPEKLTGNGLLILKVNDGPFREWNDANEAHKVMENDRVVSVAGTQGKAVELQNKMLSLTSYQAIIARPAGPTSYWC